MGGAGLQACIQQLWEVGLQPPRTIALKTLVLGAGPGP